MYFSVLVLTVIVLIGYCCYNKFLEQKSILSPISIYLTSFVILLIGIKATYLLSIFILIGCFIGIILCKKYQKKYEANSKRVAINITIIAFSTIIAFVVNSGFFDDKAEGFRNKKKQFDRASAVKLGEIFAEKCPNSKTLIIVRKEFKKHNRKKVLIDALKEGFDGKVTIKAIEYIDENLPDNASEGMIMTAINFDALIEKNKDCQVVISTIGLPLDIEKMKIWDMEEEERPKLGLLNVNVKVLREAIKAEYIAAAVMKKPSFKPSPNALPEDIKKTFDIKYVMITPENIDEISNTYKKEFY